MEKSLRIKLIVCYNPLTRIMKYNPVLQHTQMNMKLKNLYRPRTMATHIKIAVFAILYFAFSSNGWAVEDP